LALDRVHRADADLHELIRQFLLQDAREGTRVRVAVALELRVEIRMRVEVQDGETRVEPAHRPHDWIRDRVVATEHDRAAARLEQRPHGRLDLRPRIGAGRERDVARVAQRAIRPEVDAGFRPWIPGRGVQRLTDDGRGGRRAFPERRAPVVGKAEEGWWAAVRAGHDRSAGWGRG